MTLPWERRKRKCGNCKHWESRGAEFMGQCLLSIQNNGFMTGPTLVGVSVQIRGPHPLQTGEHFYCCLWQRAEASQ